MKFNTTVTIRLWGFKSVLVYCLVGSLMKRFCLANFLGLVEFEVLSFMNLGNLLRVFRSTCHSSSTFKMISSLGISMLLIVQLYSLSRIMVINLIYIRSN